MKTRPYRYTRAIFPGVVTVIALIGFLFVYPLLIRTTVAPMHWKGLPFAAPFLCFGFITALAAMGLLKTGPTILITICSMALLTGFSVCYAFYLSMDLATTTVTDTQSYEKALKLLQYPNRPETGQFPAAIPADAQNVYFAYTPAFVQGSERLCLKFETTPDAIRSYRETYEKKASWMGNPNRCDTASTGIYPSAAALFDYASDGIPPDLILYVTYSRPYRPGDWNHGVTSFVAISEARNEILFSYENS